MFILHKAQKTILPSNKGQNCFALSLKRIKSGTPELASHQTQSACIGKADRKSVV